MQNVAPALGVESRLTLKSAAVARPTETDDEEAPDYDDVLGYFPDQEQPGTPRVPKSRSRNSSYADLQRLRMTNTSTEGQ